MKKILTHVALLFAALFFTAFAGFTQTQPKKANTWVFLMAGQSNMAGRGLVEAQDTVANPRILSINKANQLIPAKEPLHFYEPTLAGLDCGLSFAREMLKTAGDSITIVMIPTAIGGSAIGQWLGDSLYRNVELLSNFREKMALARNIGIVKGILWHQGESDTRESLIRKYKDNLNSLFTIFRTEAGNSNLPILLAELGSYSTAPVLWGQLNEELYKYAQGDKNSAVIKTQDLKHKGDAIHFDSEGQRTMGKRFAEKFIQEFRSGSN